LATTDTGTRKDTKPRLSAQPKARTHPSRKQKSNPYPKILAITELRQSEQIEEAAYTPRERSGEKDRAPAEISYHSTPKQGRDKTRIPCNHEIESLGTKLLRHRKPKTETPPTLHAGTGTTERKSHSKKTALGADLPSEQKTRSKCGTKSKTERRDRRKSSRWQQNRNRS
jgi:hypothetical protein